MRSSRRLAAIDIGTVTTRLLIADVTIDEGEERIEERERRTEITYLGEGLTASGRLGEAAMERVLRVMREFVASIDRLGVEGVSVVATSASRDAVNGETFLARLSELGLSPKIVTGDREAALAFLGTTYHRRGEGLLVADLGGGSTELVLGDVSRSGSTVTREVRAARSVDVGSKRVTEMFLPGDPPTGEQLSDARIWCGEQFAPYFASIPSRPSALIAVAGTATSLSAIRQGLEIYDPAAVHDSLLTRSDLSDLLAMLAALPLAQREEVAGLEPARAPVIVAGALVLDVLLELTGLPHVVVSEHDLLYGILLDAYLDLVLGA